MAWRAVAHGVVVCGFVGAALVPATAVGAEEPPSSRTGAPGIDAGAIGELTRTTGRLAVPTGPAVDPIAGAAAACTPGYSSQIVYDEPGSIARPNLFQVRITTNCVGTLDVAFDFASYGPWRAELDVAVLELDVDARFGRGCAGTDRVVVAAIDELGPYATIIDTPSCDESTWTPLAALGVTGTSTALLVRVDRFAPRSAFSWWGYSVGLDGDADFVSDVRWVFDFDREWMLGAPDPVPSPAGATGYWMLGQGGRVHAFGDAQFHGEGNWLMAGSPTWDIAAKPDGTGYILVDPLGRAIGHGSARHQQFPGQGFTLAPGELVSTASFTPTGNGYWLFTTKGRVFPFGDAASFGDLSRYPLNGIVVDSVATSTGQGYYMVGDDGGVFCFGDAVFHGSTGHLALNEPISGIAPDPDGAGYWLVAFDGGVFAFDAPFLGSMGAAALQEPVVGIATFGTGGYLMVAQDGGIFTFGDVPFHGSLGANRPTYAIIAVAPLAIPAA